MLREAPHLSSRADNPFLLLLLLLVSSTLGCGGADAGNHSVGGAGTAGGGRSAVGGPSANGGATTTSTMADCRSDCSATDAASCSDATTRRSCQLGSDGCYYWQTESCSYCTQPANCIDVTNVEWGERSDVASGTQIAPDGSVFATSSTTATLGFTYSGPFQGSDAVLLKWTREGTPMWAATFGSSTQDLARALALGPTGEVYVGAQPMAALGNDTFFGATDVAIARISAEGKLEWVHTWGSTTTDDIAAMAVSSSTQSVAVVGNTNGAFDGQTPVGDYDIFLTDWGFDEQKGATHLYGTTKADYPNAMAIDEAGNRYIVGLTRGQFEGQTAYGGEDAFLLSVAASGSVRWVRQLGTAAADNLRGVAIADGQIVVCGGSLGDLDANDDVAVADGSVAPFVASYNAEGALNWQRQFSPNVEASASSITVTADGAIYVVVESSGDLPNRPNPGVSATALYLTRWTPVGEFEWLLGWSTNSHTRSRSISSGQTGQLSVSGSAQGPFPGFEATSPNGGAFLSLLQIK